jgi:23S rRNA (cytosine1962-C5)-methyltransferase
MKDEQNTPWWAQFSKHKPVPTPRKQENSQSAVSSQTQTEKEVLSPPEEPTGGREKKRKERQFKGSTQKMGALTPALIVTGHKSPQGMQIPVWVYDTMVVETRGELCDGATVFLESKSGKFLGSAIYNSKSKIRARLFSFGQRQFDDNYIEHAIIEAWNRRRSWYSIDDSFRVVYSEADGLPGLIVDKLSDVLVVQLLTLAVEQRREVILRTLKALFSYRGLVLRVDSPVRTREGLPVLPPEVLGDVPVPLRVKLDRIVYLCDPIHGQKTGMYLDQRSNRKLLAPLVEGKRVLDLFCHTGGWALAAAYHGAARVVGVDSSESAIQLARAAAEENGFTASEFVVSDVFDFLQDVRAKQELFDVVICDPPAFAKTHRHLEEAEKAYLSINYRAMKLLPIKGVLVTCSCSQHLTWESFELILETAARNARMRFVRVIRGQQPPDHPVLVGFPESEYLKCVALMRVE